MVLLAVELLSVGGMTLNDGGGEERGGDGDLLYSVTTVGTTVGDIVGDDDGGCREVR